jgi:transcriptional regulator with XRE-family HTH domain
MVGRRDHYHSTPRARRLFRQLAQNVRALRQDRGWSIAQLAERADLSFRGLENLETEDNMPSFVMVAYLAEALDVTMNQLLYGPLVVVDGRVQSPRTGRFVVPGPRGRGVPWPEDTENEEKGT